MHDEAGDIILGGLLKLVLFLVGLGVFVVDAGALTVNAVQLDDAANVAQAAAVRTWRPTSPTSAVEEAVRAELDGRPDVNLVKLEVTRDELELVVTRTANPLLVDRLPRTEGLVTATITRTVRAEPR